MSKLLILEKFFHTLDYSMKVVYKNRALPLMKLSTCQNFAFKSVSRGFFHMVSMLPLIKNHALKSKIQKVCQLT